MNLTADLELGNGAGSNSENDGEGNDDNDDNDDSEDPTIIRISMPLFSPNFLLFTL